MLPSSPTYLQPGQVERPPQRLTGDADQQPRPRQRGERLEPGARVGEVLEHLAADDQLGRVGAGLERRRSGRPEAISSPAPRHGARASSITSAEMSEPRTREAAAGEHHRELALAAADLVCLARAGALDELARARARKPPTSRRSIGLRVAYLS